jgi:hypothetical protein
MSSTMARQEGQVHVAQCDMRLTVNMAKMTKGGISHAAIEETQQQIKKHCTKVRQEKKRGVEIPGHKKVKAAIERYPAMVYKNHTAGGVPCQFGTEIDLQTCWRPAETAAPPPEPVAPLPGMQSPPETPPVPPGDTEGNESYKMEAMTSR